MSQEQKEYYVFRTIFVAFATLICVAIGALFAWQLAVGLGVFQFLLSMALTRHRIGFTERYPTHDNSELNRLLKMATRLPRQVMS